MNQTPPWITPENHLAKLLKVTVELGAPMSQLGQLLAVFPSSPPIPIDELRYTFGPIVYHTPRGKRDGWMQPETINRWRPRVNLERIEILCGERPDLVSPAEIWLVMYGATLEGPMQRDITEIYLWAAHRAYLASGQQFPPSFYKDHNGFVVSDEQVFDGNLAHEYRLLCQAIRRKVVAASTIHTARQRQAKT
jgi:hypothetical protein